MPSVLYTLRRILICLPNVTCMQLVPLARITTPSSVYSTAIGKKAAYKHMLAYDVRQLENEVRGWRSYCPVKLIYPINLLSFTCISATSWNIFCLVYYAKRVCACYSNMTRTRRYHTYQVKTCLCPSDCGACSYNKNSGIYRD